MSNFPSEWTELALISLIPKLSGGSVIELATPSTSIDIDSGDKESEHKATLGGGRMEKFVPEEDTVITVEAYTTSTNPRSTEAADIGFEQLLSNSESNWDTTDPNSSDTSLNRQLYNLAIVWTNDRTPTSATQGVSIGFAAKRKIFCNARVVSVKESFTDGEHKVTMKIRVPPFTKNGFPNIRTQSASGSATGTTLGVIGSLGAVSLGAMSFQ